MDIETYTSAASAAFFMLWSGYSGEALWNDPPAWVTWQAETKNRHTVRGIDNGARAGSGVAGSKPDPVACEQCGATMKAVKNGRQYTEKEIHALVEAGLAKPLSGGRFQLLGDLEDLTDDQRGPPEPRERELW